MYHESIKTYEKTKDLLDSKQDFSQKVSQQIVWNLTSLIIRIWSQNTAARLIAEIEKAEWVQRINKIIGFRHQLIHILDQKLLGIEKEIKENRNIIPVVQWWRVQDLEKNENQKSENVEKNNKTMANMWDGAFECNKLDVEESIQIVAQQNISDKLAYRALNTFKNLPTVLDRTKKISEEMKKDLRTLDPKNAVNILTTYKEIVINEFSKILPEHHVSISEEENVIQETMAA